MTNRDQFVADALGGGPHRGVGANSPLKSPLVKGFTLSPEDRADLRAFLESLTDQEFLTDPTLSDPWPSHSPAVHQEH